MQKNCLPALDSDPYSRTIAVAAGTQGHGGANLAADHVDWRKWLQDAGSRYKDYFDAGSDLRKENRLEYAQAVDAAGTADGVAVRSGSDVSVEDSGTEQGADDASSEEELDPGVRAELDAVMGHLGSRGGPLRADEVREAERLYVKEQAAARYAALKQPRKRQAKMATGKIGGAIPVHSKSRVLFECSMLQTQTSTGAWRTMSCGDLDDYVALTARPWGRVDFKAHDPVLLLRPGGGVGGPLLGKWFARSATIYSAPSTEKNLVVRASAVPEKGWSRLHVPLHRNIDGAPGMVTVQAAWALANLAVVEPIKERLHRLGAVPPHGGP